MFPFCSFCYRWENTDSRGRDAGPISQNDCRIRREPPAGTGALQRLRAPAGGNAGRAGSDVGGDFDLYAGFGALAELRCEACGKKNRTIIFRNAGPEAPFREIGFEEALNRDLERRAYIRARGLESMAVRGAKRRRS